MSKLVWDQVGERTYETGVEQAAMYPMGENNTYAKGEAWNGLTALNESSSGAEPTALYANNKKYGELMSAEEFKGTIEAYTYPDGFAACNGESTVAPGLVATQQERKMFGLVYKTLIGNDTEGTAFAYELHIVYNAKVSPSERAHATVNESPEAGTMSWEFSTTAIDVPGMKKPSAHLKIDSRTINAEKLAAIEAKLYGSELEEPTLLMPSEIIAIINGAEAEG